jgi:hypothetical protein
MIEDPFPELCSPDIYPYDDGGLNLTRFSRSPVKGRGR